MALFEDRNGIFLNGNTKSTIETQFSAELQDEYFDVEDNSWWFSYKYEVIQYFSGRFFKKGLRTYDIGGGNGYIAGRLTKDGYDMALIEPAYEACINAKRRGVLCCINGSIEDADFNICQCTCLDVLEHVEDDNHFLSSIYDKMPKGGRIILTVPAFMSLWSSEDVKLGHFRRYSRKDLCNQLESNGFRVLYSNYFFSFLFIPIWLIRVLMEKLRISKRSEELSFEENARREANQHKKRNGIVSFVLKSFEGVEMFFLRRNIRLLFGSSVIVVAEKK